MRSSCIGFITLIEILPVFVRVILKIPSLPIIRSAPGHPVVLFFKPKVKNWKGIEKRFISMSFLIEEACFSGKNISLIELLPFEATESFCLRAKKILRRECDFDIMNHIGDIGKKTNYFSQELLEV